MSKKPAVCARGRTLLRIARSSSGGSNLANQPRTGWTGPLLVERPATSQMAPSNSSPPAFLLAVCSQPLPCQHRSINVQSQSTDPAPACHRTNSPARRICMYISESPEPASRVPPDAASRRSCRSIADDRRSVLASHLHGIACYMRLASSLESSHDRVAPNHFRWLHPCCPVSVNLNSVPGLNTSELTVGVGR